eukprot:scaffold13966_cov110-Skeletonema_dohrnii-CCMP3373.AAC.2
MKEASMKASTTSQHPQKPAVNNPSPPLSWRLLSRQRKATNETDDLPPRATKKGIRRLFGF